MEEARLCAGLFCRCRLGRLLGIPVLPSFTRSGFFAPAGASVFLSWQKGTKNRGACFLALRHPAFGCPFEHALNRRDCNSLAALAQTLNRLFPIQSALKRLRKRPRGGRPWPRRVARTVGRASSSQFARSPRGGNHHLALLVDPVLSAPRKSCLRHRAGSPPLVRPWRSRRAQRMSGSKRSIV